MNITTVEEWFLLHSNEDSIENMHYLLDKTLKYIHSKGFYVIDFNFSEILTDGKSAQFKEISRIPNGNKDTVKRNNIFILACQIIKKYNEFPMNVSIDFLKEKFTEYKELMPLNVKEYFVGVMANNEILYYSDYDDKKLEDGNQRENSRTLGKNTQAGRLMSNDEAAYASTLILPAILTLVFLTALITYFILRP